MYASVESATNLCIQHYQPINVRFLRVVIQYTIYLYIHPQIYKKKAVISCLLRISCSPPLIVAPKIRMHSLQHLSPCEQLITMRILRGRCVLSYAQLTASILPWPPKFQSVKFIISLHNQLFIQFQSTFFLAKLMLSKKTFLNISFFLCSKI